MLKQPTSISIHKKAISMNIKSVIMQQNISNTADETATILATIKPLPSKTFKEAIEKQVKST